MLLVFNQWRRKEREKRKRREEKMFKDEEDVKVFTCWKRRSWERRNSATESYFLTLSVPTVEKEKREREEKKEERRKKREERMMISVYWNEPVTHACLSLGASSVSCNEKQMRY